MVQSVANVATGTAIVSGTVTGTQHLIVKDSTPYGFIAENAPVFGVAISLLSFVIAVLFYSLNYQLGRRRLMIAIEDSERGVKQNIPDEDLKMLKQWCDRRR